MQNDLSKYTIKGRKWVLKFKELFQKTRLPEIDILKDVTKNILRLANLDEETAKLHSMPCVIKRNGEANVSKYFEPIIKKQTDEVLQASFRGYPLLGKEIKVPSHYTGVVLQETNNKLSEWTDRNVYGIEKFNKFTYWNWDVEPSGNDKIAMALEWLDVADALHSPVDS